MKTTRNRHLGSANVLPEHDVRHRYLCYGDITSSCLVSASRDIVVRFSLPLTTTCLPLILSAFNSS